MYDIAASETKRRKS